MPLCSRHHHVVHEGGWTLKLALDRTLTITQPDGTIYAEVPLQIRYGNPTEQRDHPQQHRRRTTDSRNDAALIS